MTEDHIGSMSDEPFQDFGRDDDVWLVDDLGFMGLLRCLGLDFLIGRRDFELIIEREQMERGRTLMR